MSAQPNRKQQRLARELSKSEGISYQAALAEIRAPAQEPDGVVPPQRRMLDLLYETFAVTGQWPLFQYVSTRWDEVNVEAQDVYLDLAEQGLVRPAMTRSHEFQLRQETVVGVSLQGLMAMGSAAEGSRPLRSCRPLCRQQRKRIPAIVPYRTRAPRAHERGRSPEPRTRAGRPFIGSSGRSPEVAPFPVEVRGGGGVMVTRGWRWGCSPWCGLNGGALRGEVSFDGEGELGEI